MAPFSKETSLVMIISFKLPILGSGTYIKLNLRVFVISKVQLEKTLTGIFLKVKDYPTFKIYTKHATYRNNSEKVLEKFKF